MELAPGTRLGRYEIRSKLGAGGMAEVYTAEDTELKRLVALKLLPEDSTADEHARKRLLREAQSVAALTHPHICAVYDVGEDQGHRFIAMQLVAGEALDARLARGRLNPKDALIIACDIADALAEAHAHGIIHRDIKPSNVIVTPRGGAVVLDFGLARLVADDERAQADALTESALSAPGVVMGTVPYMSPEQVKGETLDGRSDIFSFGAMLYEMLGGRRPFPGKTSAATAAAILTTDPPPVTELAPEVMPELARIVAKTLRKDPNDRYQTAKDLHVDLRALREGITTSSGAFGNVAEAATRGSKAWRWLVAVALVAALAAGGWYVWRDARVRSAEAQVARLDTLVENNRYFEAYDLAVTAERVLPRDPTLGRLMPELAMTISVKTDPSGASVYLRRYAPDANGGGPPRSLAGKTPLIDLRIARGEYIVQIEMAGFAPAERTISGTNIRAGSFKRAPPPIDITQRLIREADTPARMVPVPGTEYRLAAWERPTDRRVRLDDYYIDKYEVSNSDFKEFIAAGGYLKREYWKVPFVKDGRTLSFDDAMGLLLDRSGLPGPRQWTAGNVPDGKADHPVTDITWYEAAAYAAFRGKTLPTMFQWERAARMVVAAPVNFMPWGVFYAGDSLAYRANFEDNGTVPVSRNDFGMSPFGAYNMAGNVTEWTQNDSSEGFIATGGAWGDPTYVFAQYPKYPGFYTSGKLGFRCALTPAGATGNQGAERIEIRAEIPSYTASSASDFAKWRALYDYKLGALDARIEDVQETQDWRRERITFTGANGQRAIAYLYLPLHVARPLQVIHFVPAADVDRGFRSLPASMEDRLAAFLKAGRAAFGVVLTGYMERLRPGAADRPDARTVEYFDELVARVTDLRRGLDYLATRPDIDGGRLAFFGPSAGGQLGLVLAAVEPRYKAVALVGSGLPASTQQIFASANPINFAAHIKPPKLMFHGKYDEDTPLLTAGMPLYDLLPQPKRLITFEGGHSPSSEQMFQNIGPFFDEVMGRVKR